jgi:cyclopropane fatty-acyl-phospholipid synthase-like methyltransferase
MQREHGLYKLLSHSGVYEFLQQGLGADHARRELVRRWIRPESGNRLLDIGCGPGSLLPFLPESLSYVGVDLNPKYIETAKQTWGHRGEFRVSTVHAMPTEPASFDVVIAISLLHHLDNAEATRLFSLAHGALKNGGRLVTIDPTYAPEQSAAARFIISRDRGQHVRSPGGYHALACQVFSPVGVTVVHDLLRIPYSHVILECDKK